MSFDMKKFEASNFTARTSEVSVPALKDFFGKDEKPIFVVRGLKGAEIGKANEAKEKAVNIASMINALVSKNEHEKVEGFKAMLGVSDDVPSDVIRRQELLALGAVKPELSYSQSVKLSEMFPVEFFALSNEILKLSGQGSVVGKQKPSGKTKTSEQA